MAKFAWLVLQLFRIAGMTNAVAMPGFMPMISDNFIFMNNDFQWIRIRLDISTAIFVVSHLINKTLILLKAVSLQKIEEKKVKKKFKSCQFFYQEIV